MAVMGSPKPMAMNASAMKEPTSLKMSGGVPNSSGDWDQRKMSTVSPMNPKIEKKNIMNNGNRWRDGLGCFMIY